MKLSLTIDFDSWEEYAEFSKRFQLRDEASQSLVSPIAVAPPIEEKPKERKTETLKSFSDARRSSLPEEVIQKVNQYIESRQPFTLKDVAGEKVLRAGSTRGRVTRWLKEHPLLTSRLENFHPKGIGGKTIVYSPIQDEQPADAVTTSPQIQAPPTFAPDLPERVNGFIAKKKPFQTKDVVSDKVLKNLNSQIQVVSAAGEAVKPHVG